MLFRGLPDETRRKFAVSGVPLLSMIAFCLLGALDRPACAQISEYPTRTYYLSFEWYHEGEYRDALKAFNSARRDGIRSTEGRWVDSICYFTMEAECYYQMGYLSEALERYTSALNLFLAHRFWMLRVNFPPLLEQVGLARRPITWGASARGVSLGSFPKRVPILQGKSLAENERAIVQGGLIALPEYVMINAHEICRCTALAIRRRREIMGAACEHDPLTLQVYEALSIRPARARHWSEAWIHVQLGMAAAAAGKDSQAISELGKGLLAAGQYDHPLTAIAFMELGKLAFENEQYGTATKSFYEASISAAWFSQYDLVAEALTWAALTHTVTGQTGIYPALGPASNWARRDSRQLEVAMIVAAAENAVANNQTGDTLRLLEQARRRMLRTDLLSGAVGARFHYASAVAAYQSADLKGGDRAFQALMNYQRRGSRRLFEIGLVDRLYTTGTVSERIANRLFAKVLREPSARDWALAPMETLSVALTPHSTPLEHWFDAALRRKEYERAIEIADRIRRHRFHITLPLGGRLLSLRWVLEAPLDGLSEAARLQRQELLTRFPRYGQFAKRAAEIKQQVSEGPLLPDEDKARRVQARQMAALGEVSNAQEVLLREIALRRAPSDFVFPPPLDFKQTQADLPAGSLVLAFLATKRDVYAFEFGRESYPKPWRVEAPVTIRRDIAGLLRSMGHIERNQPVELAQLQSEAWKAIGGRLLEQLTNKSEPTLSGTSDELIIVPDGPLWYVPFEALQVREGESTVPLISQVRVRYVPTVSTVLPDDRRSSPIGETAVVAGQLFPRDDPSIATAAVAELGRVLPRVTELTAPLAGPSNLYATLCERVVVLADLDQRARGPYGWSPLPLDRGKPGSSLASWMSLPWGGPQQIVLPGFHTPAENALKNGGSGQEIFLAVCGMMSTGSRTLLLSRWRTGGQTSYDLTREFVQELPHTTASDAWQRSVELVMDNEIAVDREPRVKAGRAESGVKSHHPFFWAGYLLVDTGAVPNRDDAESEVADAK